MDRKSVQREARNGLARYSKLVPTGDVHVEVAKLRAAGREIVMIGHLGHPEVEGTMGQSEGGMHLVESVEDVERLQVRSPELLAYVTQTTLSLDDAAAIIAALKQRFPSIAEPKKADICYATQNRQDAVKFMAPQVDVVIVVGSEQLKSNRRAGEPALGVAHICDNADQPTRTWLAAEQNWTLPAHRRRSTGAA